MKIITVPGVTIVLPSSVIWECHIDFLVQQLLGNWIYNQWKNK